ncbi:unnamed protein product [Angiostrongylus costaricensis]|uniref:CUB domain-containing protein n=1 Tax=Angiostrongylus costaricensis TaxID=334426 RepID=A0A158PL62_ANGCS|nr:unnamed protein product [Angiostrongylus costaricensis]
MEKVSDSDPGYSGLAFTRECSLCPPGTSSKGGPKAERCTERPACRSSDYYPITEPCTNGTTRTTYKKVQPAVCRDDIPGAATLPPPSATRPCPLCNPGMAKDASGICTFCPAEHFSEGDEISTACNIGEAWLASGTALVSAQSLQRGIAMELELIIKEGFSNPLAPRDFTASQHSPVAQFSVVFETSCADSSCVLYMIESPVEQSKTQPYRFLAAFNGSQPRRVWSHSILERRSARFMVAFLRSGSTSGDDAILDQARILSINVTNIGAYRGVQGGGASRCLPCPKGSFGKTWTTTGVKVFAREGASYYHSFNFSLFSEKVQCKEAYDPNDAFSMNDQSREVVTGAACRLTVLPDIGRNRTKLAFVSPLLLATRLEEVSLRRDRLGWQLTDQLLEYEISTKKRILKTFCVFFIMNSSTYTSYTLLVKYSCITEGVEEASRPIDVHFWFDAVGATSEACPRGNAYVATARCAPGKKEVEFRLPRTCPDGTCDGCLFHAIVESVQACPVCRAGDYEMIRGECVNGQQTIHYIPDKLEYKYTRLVESRSGELPTAETCGLVDDEDDEATDRVIFAKGRRKVFSGRDTDAFVPLENED